MHNSMINMLLLIILEPFPTNLEHIIELMVSLIHVISLPKLLAQA